MNEKTRIARQITLLALIAAAGGAAAQTGPAPGAGETGGYEKLPISFEENRGQTDPRVRFLSRTPGATLFLTPDEAVLSLGPERVLRLGWQGGDPEVRLSGEEERPARTHYLVGRSPESWHTGIPSYARVHYHGIYPGIDLVFRGNGRQLEYDVIVAPDARPEAVRMTIRGADRARIDAAGDLVLGMGDREVRLPRPVSWQETAAGRRGVKSSYRLERTGPTAWLAGFAVEGRDPALPLVIDPALVYSTYLGGGHWDEGRGIATDYYDGNTYVVGLTASVDFPTQGPSQPLRDGSDAFLAKLDARGNLIFSTLIGGSDADHAEAVAVDRNFGEIYLIGTTASPDFPRVRPLQPSFGGASDAFAVKLAPDGTTLRLATTLGGSRDETGEAIALDSPGGWFTLVGSTRSSDFPATGPWRSLAGGSDGFVARVSPSLQLLCASYLGGSGDDVAHGVATWGIGGIHIVGTTSSSDLFPVNAIQSRLSGPRDAFLMGMMECGSGIGLTTYLGGTGSEEGLGIALDGAANIYVAGSTTSHDFPVRSAFQSELRGSMDAFLVKIGAGLDLEHATYLGGSSVDAARAIAVSSNGEATLGGATSSLDFPTVEPIQKRCGPVPDGAPGTCFFDGFVTRFDAAQTRLLWSTYLGGTEGLFDRYPGEDAVTAVAVDLSGDTHVTGWTYSKDFPTVSAYQPDIARAYDGENDAFVTKISPVTNRPPDCSTATVDPSTLWPPNGRWVRVSLLGPTDPDGDPVTSTVTAIHQDEPVGREPDAAGVGTAQPWVRAERDGQGDGRVYHLAFQATDGRGGACDGAATLCVPHDQRPGATCGNGGTLVPSH